MGKSSKLKQRAEEAKESAFQARFAENSRLAAYRAPLPPLVNEFTAYRSFFVRSPDDFSLRTRSSHRSKQALEMARHLFGRFRVPRTLEQVWEAYVSDAPADRRELPRTGRFNGAPAPERLKNVNLRNTDFRAWYICVATGGSLYKEHTKGLLSKKETFVFLNAPAALDLCQSVIYAVARCAGANDGEAQRLARSKISEKPFGEFWFDAVRFFCLPGNMPRAVSVVDDLSDYLSARHMEDRAFRLLGSSQSLAAVLRRMEQWHRALARAKDLSGVAWTGVDLPDHTIERKAPKMENLVETWHFHQIITGKELAAEGTAQRHCVFGYKTRCIKGDCSIWSLTKAEPFGVPARRLTIEVNRYGEIVQKRGLANRLPRAEEEHIVSLWASKFGLRNR